MVLECNTRDDLKQDGYLVPFAQITGNNTQTLEDADWSVMNLSQSSTNKAKKHIASNSSSKYLRATNNKKSIGKMKSLVSFSISYLNLY